MRKSARNVKFRKHICDHMVEASTNTTTFPLSVNSFNSPLKMQTPAGDF